MQPKEMQHFVAYKMMKVALDGNTTGTPGTVCKVILNKPAWSMLHFMHSEHAE